MCLCMIDKYDSTPYHVMTKKKNTIQLTLNVSLYKQR